MDVYKKWFRQTWCATGDVKEVDEKHLAAIRKLTGLSSEEVVVLFAYMDGMIRDQVFVIVTNQRVIAGHNYRKVKQALFKNVEQIERKLNNIQVHAKGEDFPLFIAPFWPPRPELVDRAFQVANDMWLARNSA